MVKLHRVLEIGCCNYMVIRTVVFEAHFGAGNTNWIREGAFDKDLQMHFGRKIAIEDFRNSAKTTYSDIFDFIEIYYARALGDLDLTKRMMLLKNVCTAFINSGSVYEFNKNGHVVLKIDDVMAGNISKTKLILEPLENAKKIYVDCVSGLTNRTKEPRDIVGDMNIVFEDFVKQNTNESSFDKAIKKLGVKTNLHPTQVSIIDKLIAYRGDVWGGCSCRKQSRAGRK